MKPIKTKNEVSHRKQGLQSQKIDIKEAYDDEASG